MAQQVQELINKIKAEGVEAAEQKAKEIETQARQNAEKIVLKAKQEAERIVLEAKAEVKKMQESTTTALKQSARDMLLTLRKEIEVRLNSIVKSSVADALSAEKLADIIGVTIKSFLDKQTKGVDIKLVLSTSDLEKLKKGFLSKLKEQLKQGIELQSSDEIGKGFTISFDAGKSFFDFTDLSLTEYLSAYLNPEVAALLKDSTTS